MPRPQFTLRALLVAILAMACFVGGTWLVRERQRREDEVADSEASRIPAENYRFFSGGSRWFACIAVIDPSYAGSVRRLLDKNGFESIISGSDVSVPLGHEDRALSLLRKHANPYRWVEFGQEGSSATQE